MQAKKASDLIKKKSGRNSQSQKDVQRLTYAQRKRKLQRQQIVDSKNGKINEVDGVLKEEKYRTLINQLSGLNLGGLLQLVEALDKKRSLYGIHLSSIDAMYVLCICSVQGEQAHVVSHTWYLFLIFYVNYSEGLKQLIGMVIALSQWQNFGLGMGSFHSLANRCTKLNFQWSYYVYSTHRGVRVLIFVYCKRCGRLGLGLSDAQFEQVWLHHTLNLNLIKSGIWRHSNGYLANPFRWMFFFHH